MIRLTDGRRAQVVGDVPGYPAFVLVRFRDALLGCHTAIPRTWIVREDDGEHA